MKAHENIVFSPPEIDTTPFIPTPEYVQEQSELVRFDEFDCMIHRTSNRTHTLRTGEIAKNVFYLVLPDELISIENVPVLMHEEEVIGIHSLQHDDEEPFMTDWPSHQKLNWSEKKKEIYARYETMGLEVTGSQLLGLEGIQLERYKEYGVLRKEKQTIGVQCEDVADKLDALGEIMHELRCGNESFVRAYEYYIDEKLPKFENYWFWDKLKNNPYFQLDKLPNSKEILAMPKLTIDDIRSKDSMKEDLRDSSLPRWYRTWLEMSFNIFYTKSQPELFILPGWKKELRRKFNTPDLQD